MSTPGTSTLPPGCGASSDDFPAAPRPRRKIRHLRPLLAVAMFGSLASALPPPTTHVLHPGAYRGKDGQGARLVIPVSPVAALPGGIKPLLPLTPEQAVLTNASRPFAGPVEKVPQFRFAAGVGDSERERAVQCLAAAAWYEAGDDAPGERAVIQVVLNRLRHPSYPKSICGVVFEGSDRRTGCQFTFTCDGSLARVPGEKAWLRARKLAEAALDGAVDTAVGAATHYHADYVVPYWASSLEKLSQVGAHIFYRFPGYWGTRAVLRGSGFAAEPAVAQLARFSPSHVAPPADGLPLPGDPAAAGQAVAELTLPQAPVPMSPKPSSAIFMAVDAGGAAGRWALDALKQCQGKADCQVLAWGSSGLVEVNRARPSEQRDRPLFVFLRNQGMGVALWDCALVRRSDPSQCLPTDAAALKALVRERG